MEINKREFPQELWNHPEKNSRLFPIQVFTNTHMRLIENRVGVTRYDIRDADTLDLYVERVRDLFIVPHNYEFGWCMLAHILHKFPNRFATRTRSYVIQMACSNGYTQIEFYKTDFVDFEFQADFLFSRFQKTKHVDFLLAYMNAHRFENAADVTLEVRTVLNNPDIYQCTVGEQNALIYWSTRKNIDVTPFGMWKPTHHTYKCCSDRMKQEILWTLLMCKRVGLCKDVTRAICSWVCTE